MTLTLTDPLVLKAGGGIALYALGGSRTARLVGLALVGWAAWDYLKSPPPSAAPRVIPYDPDAPLPLTQAATSSAGETQPQSPDPGAGNVIPFRRPTQDERGMFYGLNPEPDNAG